MTKHKNKNSRLGGWRLRKLRHDNEGATLIEFAVICPIMFVLMLGVVEFSMMYASMSVLESATQRVAREQKALAGQAGGNISGAQVRNRIIANSSGFLEEDKLTIWVSNWNNWGTTYDHVEGWGREGEANGNEGFTGTVGSSGGASRVVQYEVYYAHHFLIPYVGRMLGASSIWDTTQDGKGIVLRTSTVVQNEPPLL